VGAPRISSPAIFYAVCVIVPAVLGAAAVVLSSIVRGGIIAWSPTLLRPIPEPVHVKRRQLRHLIVRGPEPGRMILGQRANSLIASEPRDSLIVLGPRGSGRTSTICVPIIQEWDGAVIAAGLGQDLIDSTAGIRQRQGTVEIYDPAAVTRLATCTWSSLAGCEVMDVAVRRAGWMMPAPPSGGAGDREVVDAPRGDPSDLTPTAALLAVSLWAGARTGSSVGEIRRWLRDPTCQLLREAVQRGGPADPRAAGCLAALASMSGEDRAARCAAVEVIFETTEMDAAVAYTGRPVGHPAGMPPLDPPVFLRGEGGGDGTLHLVVPPDEPQRTAPLMSGVLGSLLDEAFGLAAAGRSEALRPVLVVLDGTAAGAPVRELAHYLAVSGAIGITFVVTFDGVADVERGYGSMADDVIGSAQAAIFLGRQDEPRTLGLMADLARRSPAGAASPRLLGGRGRLSGSRSASLVDSAALFGPGHALLFSETLPPLPLWTRPWYETPRLDKAFRSQPYMKGIGWAQVIDETSAAR
jgi:hypothetical protein